MFRFLLLALGLIMLGGCAFAQDAVRLLEPMIDQAAKFGANSAGLAVEEAMKKHMGEAAANNWTGGEIAATTGGIVMSAYAAIKGAIFAWNRKPKGA